MRKSRFNDEQILAIVQETEAGAGSVEVCRRRANCWIVRLIEPWF